MRRAMERIGVFLCHCRLSPLQAAGAEKVIEAVSRHPAVVYAEIYQDMCLQPELERVEKAIRDKGLDGVVLTSCSPSLHQESFHNFMTSAGLSRQQFEIANLRERVDGGIAPEKAIEVIEELIERLCLAQPLPTVRLPVIKKALVIGGGVAGIQAALDIADAGYELFLVERDPSIGGHMLQYSEVFPTLDCPQCIMTPKMVEVSQHPNIELLTYCEVEEVSGYAGNFKVKIRKKARYIDEDKCTGCGDCLSNCPLRYIPQPSAITQGKEGSGKGKEKEVERSEITLEIDGREVKAIEGMTILEAAKSVGIEIPTLCYHPALSPFGACRMCSVEITSRGRSRIVTSCSYPVAEGLVVDTKSPKVIKIRKMLSELLLARCPNVEVIQDLAREHGVEKPRFELVDEKCILCGLCTRICEERMGVSAINFVGRGVDRKVKTPFQMTLDINFDVCMGCGACVSVCPTGAITLEDITRKKPMPILSEFDEGLALRAPVYVPFAQAVPNIPVIDRDKCVHFLTDKCKICQDLCTAKAINFEQEDKIIEVEVGSIVVATGFELYPKENIHEYADDPDILNGIQFERILCPGGPTDGVVVRPSDGKTPKEVVFISCVGSRDPEHGFPYCSRVCCMYLAKMAMLYKHAVPDGQAYIFYMDTRTTGKGYEEFVQRAVEEDGVIYLRGRVSKVFREGEKLKVWGVDTLSGKRIDISCDLVVLGMAVVPNPAGKELAQKLGILSDEYGFIKEIHPKLRPLETSVPGIYVAGAAQGPKDIPDSVAQASGAASKVLVLFSSSELMLEKVA